MKLNKPKALNALNINMINLMTDDLKVRMFARFCLALSFSLSLSLSLSLLSLSLDHNEG